MYDIYRDKKNAKNHIITQRLCLEVLQNGKFRETEIAKYIFLPYFYPLKIYRSMKKIIILALFFTFAASLAFLSAQNSRVEQLIKEGVELHDAGEHKKAVEKYNEALKIDPKSTLATYELALSYLELKDYRNASRLSTEVINSNDPALSTGAYAVKSEALAEMNRVDDAIKLLREGLVKNGDKYLLHFNLALNYYKKRDLDNTHAHVKRAIELEKSYAGAFLLNAYVLNDKGYWVQSILSFQMFLLLEPDSRRAKNAFAEMLQTMRIKPETAPVERSFIQQQMMRNRPDNAVHPAEIPPLTTVDGLNRNFVYHAVTTAMDSLKQTPAVEDEFTVFTVVNKEIMRVLERENAGDKEGVFWTFYVPIFTQIANSTYYNTYSRYISVSYFPESLVWWNENSDEAEKFVNWFENGEN